MKYEAKNLDGVAVSQADGLPWVNIVQADAIVASEATCSGCHLITEGERLTIAQNVLNVDSNWSGGSVGSGFIYQGHSDYSPDASLAASASDTDGYFGTGNVSPSNQRRTLTLSNGEVIWDFSGNVSEIADAIIPNNHPGSIDNVYTEWNQVTNHGAMSPDPFPSFGTPAAAAWTSEQGIGGVQPAYINTDSETSASVPARGGDYDIGGVTAWKAIGAGIYALSFQNLVALETAGAATVGFRAARRR